MDVAIAYGKEHGGSDINAQVDAALDRLLVEFGKEILKIVPGRVSTEVDAHYSFSTKGSVDKALHIIEVSSEFPISKARIQCTDTVSSFTSPLVSPRSAF